MKGGDEERGSAARPRAPWKRGGEGELERRRSKDMRKERAREGDFFCIKVTE